MEDGAIKVVVEVPKGGRNKYERNEESGELELDRRLPASVSYPTEYGYIEDTEAEDGDELDALVAITEPTFPGCVIYARPVAILHLSKPDGRANPKIFCVPLSDPAWNGVEKAQDIQEELRDEIAHFFAVYSSLYGEGVEVHGWGSREEATDMIRESRERRSATNGH